MANIAEQIEHRYRRTGATRYTGDPANIPQRLLMPSVNDASLWRVRVKVRASVTFSNGRSPSRSLAKNVIYV